MYEGWNRSANVGYSSPGNISASGNLEDVFYSTRNKIRVVVESYFSPAHQTNLWNVTKVFALTNF